MQSRSFLSHIPEHLNFSLH